MTKYIKMEPTPKQATFMVLENFGVEEALYGGAAGGAKSWALLACALQYVDVPGYAAILFRRTYSDLALPGALMDVADRWLQGTDAHWNGTEKQWTFPSRATLNFGYLDDASAMFRYQSSRFHYQGWDELTQFPERWYRYVTSTRNRRELGFDVPLRIRAASNPGGVGHDWCNEYFVDPKTAKALFLPAKLDDNPHIDRESYVRSLMKLDPITRRQMLEGDWTAREVGVFFTREKLSNRILDTAPPLVFKYCRYWDFAATAAAPGKDPDWTVGALLSQDEKGQTVIRDIQRFRCRPADVEARIRRTAVEDGKTVPVWLEQEPGSSGVSVIDHYVRSVLNGWEVQGHKTTGEKAVRAGPLASQVEAGNVSMVRADWNRELLDEFEAFPNGSHDDIVDACSGAFNKLSEMDEVGDFGFTVYKPKQEGAMR